jgi:hypothetical protein
MHSPSTSVTPARTRAFSVGLRCAKEPADLSDRKQMWRAVARLTPAQRVVLTNLCGALVPPPKGPLHALPETAGTLNECYADLSMLVAFYHVPVGPLIEKIEAFIREGGG